MIHHDTTGQATAPARSGDAVNKQAVDPTRLAAEMEVRLASQGFPPGTACNRVRARAAAVAFLAALDIPSTDDAGSRRIARRVAALAVTP